MSKAKTIVTVKYEYADGTPGEVVKEVYGENRVKKEIEYIQTWLANHKRSVTSVEVK